MKFIADNVRISGPRIDGTYTIHFEAGDYEKEKLLDIMKMELPLYVEVKEESPSKA